VGLTLHMEETVYLDFITRNPLTNAIQTADVLPTCDVYENATDAPILSPVVTLRVGFTGHYRVPVAATSANGFNVQNSYNVVVSATVGGVADKAILETVQMVAARKLGAVVADVGNTATTFKTNLTEAANDWWAKAFLLFIDNASLVGQIHKITAYNAGTKFVTTDTFTAAPAGTDPFQIINF